MTAAVDYVVDLNNWLQSSPEGDVAAGLTWAMTQEGQNHKAVHHAVAKFRGVNIGEGQGTSKGIAKRAAAEQALIYLNQNPLPQRQA